MQFKNLVFLDNINISAIKWRDGGGMAVKGKLLEEKHHFKFDPFSF